VDITLFAMPSDILEGSDTRRGGSTMSGGIASIFLEGNTITMSTLLLVWADILHHTASQNYVSKCLNSKFHVNKKAWFTLRIFPANYHAGRYLLENTLDEK